MTNINSIGKSKELDQKIQDSAETAGTIASANSKPQLFVPDTTETAGTIASAGSSSASSGGASSGGNFTSIA